jgi:signal transduction histidine kinase
MGPLRSAAGAARPHGWPAWLRSRRADVPSAPAGPLPADAAGMLAAVARELALAADLADLGALVTRRAAALCQADAALLYLRRTPHAPPILIATDGRPAGDASGGAEPGGAPCWLIHSRHAFVSNDTRRDPRVLYLGPGPRHLSVMFAPLRLGASGGEGALVVCANRANAFTTTQLARLAALADQSAAVVSNALLLADVERRAERMAELSRAGQRIAGQTTMPDVLAAAARELAAVFGVTHVCAVALAEHGRVLAEAHQPARPMCSGRELAQLATAQPLLVADLRASDQLPELRLRLLERGAHSVLVLPLRRGDDERTGTVALIATGSRPAFTREDQEQAAILAGQTAVALEQARLLRSALDARRRGEAILQSSFTAIITVDRRLRVQDVNSAAVDLLGLPASYLRQRPLTEVLGASAWDLVQPMLAGADAPDHRAPPVECMVPARSQPREREVLLGVGQLPEGFVISMTDITRLKEVDRLRSELVANVSHDLKGPLATIRAYTELLLEGLDDEDPALRQTFLEYIDAEVERLNGYITNMLDVARIESGDFQPKRERLCLADVVEAAVASVRPRAAANAVEIRVSLPEPAPEILADRHLVHALLANLVDNAVKFSPAGATVSLTARRAADGLDLAVADDGPGIPPDALPHIFDKFYRATSTVEGSGLGLVIARRAARAHGGDVTVLSAPGEGSTFTAHLPTAALAPAATRLPTPAATQPT